MNTNSFKRQVPATTIVIPSLSRNPRAEHNAEGVIGGDLVDHEDRRLLENGAFVSPHVPDAYR